MKKAIFFILFIPCVSNIFSQESMNLILQFYGYNKHPYKEIFIANNLPTEATQEDVQKLISYYEQNEKDILSRYDYENYLVLTGTLKQIQKENREAALKGLGSIAVATAQGIVAYNQQKAEEEAREKQEEAIRIEQQKAEFAARQAESKQKYAEFQSMTNRKVHTSDYQLNTSSYSTQDSYSDLLTSDPDRNIAVQKSVQQYGTNATRNAVNQARAYDAQSRSTGGYGGQVISAVTSNRQAIKIQVRDRKIGGKIVAYSLGGNALGEQQWRPIDTTISKCTSNLEYQYTSYIQGVGSIYFDL